MRPVGSSAAFHFHVSQVSVSANRATAARLVHRKSELSAIAGQENPARKARGQVGNDRKSFFRMF
jgi:hypothetical protein